MATKPKPFDCGRRVFKWAGGGTRIGIILKTLGRKTWEVKFSDSEVLERLKLSQFFQRIHPQRHPQRQQS
jgi:hypothetical protein